MPLRVQAPMQSSKPRYAWSHSLAYNVQRKTCGELAALLYKSAPQLSTAMHPNVQPVKVRTSDGGWRHGYACIRPRRRFRSEVVSRTDPCLWVAVPLGELVRSYQWEMHVSSHDAWLHDHPCMAAMVASGGLGAR